MGDITDEEEAALPLPPNWIKLIATNNKLVYKNLSTQIDREEHPILTQALSVAKRLPLADGWQIRETVPTYTSSSSHTYTHDTHIYTHTLICVCIHDYIRAYSWIITYTPTHFTSVAFVKTLSIISYPPT